ncbi:MAG: microviridin/marinostatin family tricyclic proteinase inhibitor [Rivularia sp. (in: cyanobacteria)]
MSNNKDNAAKNSSSVPFFARYLEGQFISELSEEEMDRVKGGKNVSRPIEHMVTSLKYPSDNEDSSPTHPIVTNKYGDIDDISSGGGFTKKYPSDADEAMTMKYPSDGDDDLPTDFFERH